MTRPPTVAAAGRLSAITRRTLCPGASANELNCEDGAGRASEAGGEEDEGSSARIHLLIENGRLRDPVNVLASRSGTFRAAAMLL